MSTSKRALIWDIDGVIADTAEYHFEAWQYVFQKQGVKFTKEEFLRNFGQRNDTIIRITLGAGIPPEKAEAIAIEKEENYRKRAKGHVKPLPGVIELLKSLGEHGFACAVASSGPIENIQLVLRELGIEDYFQAIVYGREVTEGKPSPQVFLLAAKKLGVEPGNCIVIEDAVAGVAAAKRAGMRCIAVTNTHPRENLVEADLVVTTLAEVSVNKMERLIIL